MERTIRSVHDFLAAITERPKGRYISVYRGHTQTGWKLLPSVLRQPRYRRNEARIIREMIAAEPSEFQHDASTLDRLVRAQHYSAPTRLLDVTKNPLVALYFATFQKTGTGQVFALRVPEYRQKYFDSDAVSAIANLCQLSETERKSLDPLLDRASFNVLPAALRLHQFIRQEKPYFLPQIDPSDMGTVFLVRPKLSNKRIIAQSGLFVIFGITQSIIGNDLLSEEIEIDIINIPESCKATVQRELDLLAINGHTLFPEIENAALYITRNL